MTVVQLLVGLLTLVVNAFFVGAEFALISVRREPDRAAGRGRRAQGAAACCGAWSTCRRCWPRPSSGITACTLVLGIVAEPAIAHLLEPAFHAAHLPQGSVHPVSFVIALAVATYLHMLFGEMVPKNIALAEPVRTALSLGPPLVALTRALRPLIFAVNALANAGLRLVRVEPRTEVESAFSDAELSRMVVDAGAAGLLDERAAELLRDALELGRRPVGEIVLPPERVVRAPLGITAGGAGVAQRPLRLLPFPGRRRRGAGAGLSARQGRARRRAAGRALPPVRAAAHHPGRARRPRWTTCSPRCGRAAPTWRRWWTTRGAGWAWSPCRTYSRSWSGRAARSADRPRTPAPQPRTGRASLAARAAPSGGEPGWGAR